MRLIGHHPLHPPRTVRRLLIKHSGENRQVYQTSRFETIDVSREPRARRERSEP